MVFLSPGFMTSTVNPFRLTAQSFSVTMIVSGPTNCSTTSGTQWS